MSKVHMTAIPLCLFLVARGAVAACVSGACDTEAEVMQVTMLQKRAPQQAVSSQEALIDRRDEVLRQIALLDEELKEKCLGDYAQCQEGQSCCTPGFECIRQPYNENAYCIPGTPTCDVSQCDSIQGQGKGECQAMKKLACCQETGKHTPLCCDDIFLEFGFGIMSMTPGCNNGCDLSKCSQVTGQGLGECLGETRVACCMDAGGSAATCCEENVAPELHTMIAACRAPTSVMCGFPPHYASCREDASACTWNCDGLHHEKRSIDCPFGSYPEMGDCPGGHCLESKYTCGSPTTVHCADPPKMTNCQENPSGCHWVCHNLQNTVERYIFCPKDWKPTMGPCPGGHCMESDYFCAN